MKQTAIMLIMFGTLIVGNPSAQADSGNPFGFETNTHPLEYEYCKKDSDLLKGHYGYRCNSAPRIHPEFKEYFLFFVEDVGLCSIWTLKEILSRSSDPDFSPRIEAEIDKFIGLPGNDERTDIKNIVEMFKLQIAKKYGPPTRKSDNLLRSLSLRERTYGYDWATRGRINGLGDVKAIKLEAAFAPESRWPSAAVPSTGSMPMPPGFAAFVEKDSPSRFIGPEIVHVIFWLVTFDACLKKIDDNRYLAF